MEGNQPGRGVWRTFYANEIFIYRHRVPYPGMPLL